MADEAPRANRPRQRTFHIVRQLLIAVLVVAVLPAIYLYFGSTDHAPAPVEAAGPSGPLPVTVIVMEPRDVPIETRFLAQTEASQLVPIRARVSGYLLERSFTEGQRVEQGQVLFRIDPEPFEVALAQADAQLAASRARLQRAEQQLQRVQRLVAQQAASADELEQWQEEQQVAAADVKLQQARLAQVQLDLDYTTITSPIAGMIGERAQDEGSYISPSGESLLATVRQVDPIYVRYAVSEQELLQWERLQSEGAISNTSVEHLDVEIILPDGRIHPETGKISFVDVAVDPSTGTAVVRATVPNPGGALRPGQFVTARVKGVNRVDALVVPQSAVMQNPTGTTVYVIDDQGLAQLRPVVPGDWHGSEWVIDSGLVPGDRVIVDRLMQLRPGTPVQAVVPGSEPAAASGAPASSDGSAAAKSTAS